MDFKESLAKEEGGNMAHTVQSEAEQTKHLGPLSVYAKMMTCDQKTSVQHPWNSFDHFTNFKIEILNNFAQKRKFEHSSCDDGYETPSKKIAFDFDVDDILCLSPISTNAAAVKDSDGVISSQNPINSIFYNKPRQKDLPKKMQQEMEENRNVNEGHFTVSYTEELPSTASSPLPTAVEDKAPRHGCHSETPSQQISLAEQQDSITDSGLCSNGSMLVLDSWNSNAGGFQDVDSVPCIGLPIFESSLCCDDSVSVDGEHTRELSLKELPGTTTDFFDSSHTTQEGDTGDTSCEATSHLKVKVKSVVVVPKPHATCFKPDITLPEQNGSLANLAPEEKCECAASGPRSQRAAVLNRELTWEQEKNQYVHLVTKHINGKAETQDVMTELLSLMNQVADQTPAGDTPWQHPSNLTRWNYQRHFGFSTPKMSLQEWQGKNSTTHKRFATVPRFFERSPLP